MTQIRHKIAKLFDVYAYCTDSSPQEIVDNQCIQLKRSHKVSESNKRIPKLFMIPKFHKRPNKFYFHNKINFNLLT